ncbi:hypothetical protein BGX28_007110 [Mortierella sp. GBA30]|nr:hypothetical protein BGX28_007110 [Mortierella sp. GBA30]
MTDNHLTLFCLVDGQPSSRAFEIEVTATRTVAHLKDLIKTKQTPAFDDITADQLTLWHVSVTIKEDDDETPILLANLPTKKKLRATSKLFVVFAADLPEDTIHVIVQRPGLITELDFLRCVPDAIIGEQQERSAGLSYSLSFVSLSCSPRSWDILNIVRSMELDPTPQYERPRFMEDRRFRPESMLHDLFKHDFGSVKVMPPFAETTQIMRLRRGEPDLVCLKKNGDPELPESVLFPIEIKRPVILRSQDLVQDYLEQDRSGYTGGIVNAVNQAYGYIRLNGYRYGILSTYEQTWFMKRGEQCASDVMISPPIAFDITEPSFLQCYVWFIRQANADERPLDPPTDIQRDQMLRDERRNDKRRRAARPDKKKSLFKAFISSPTQSASSKATSRVTLPDFERMELISHNERAQTYKASWRGHEVVVKKCDIWNECSVAEELKNEAKVYQKLQGLQGRYIPKLWLAGVADGLEMLLVIDFVGRDVGQELLDDSALGKIREAMSAIHEMGVVHGDIRPQNIVVQHQGLNTKFFFVDFGFSRFTVDKTELVQEKATLNSLLRNIAAARLILPKEFDVHDINRSHYPCFGILPAMPDQETMTILNALDERLKAVEADISSLKTIEPSLNFLHTNFAFFTSIVSALEPRLSMIESAIKDSIPAQIKNQAHLDKTSVVTEASNRTITVIREELKELQKTLDDFRRDGTANWVSKADLKMELAQSASSDQAKSSSSKTKVPTPSPFSGDRSDWKTFLSHLALYFTANATLYPTDSDKMQQSVRVLEIGKTA